MHIDAEAEIDSTGNDAIADEPYCGFNPDLPKDGMFRQHEICCNGIIVGIAESREVTEYQILGLAVLKDPFIFKRGKAYQI